MPQIPRSQAVPSSVSGFASSFYQSTWIHASIGFRPSLVSRLEAITSRLEVITSRLESIAIRLEAMAIRLEAIAIQLVCCSAWHNERFLHS